MAFVQRRPLSPQDIDALAALLPAFDFHYGALQSPEQIDVFSSLLQSGAITGLKIVTSPKATACESNAPILAAGVTGFLPLDYAQALIKTPPSVELTQHLYQSEMQNQPVLLRPDAIAKANSEQGMALVFLHFALNAGSPDTADQQQLLTQIQSSFRLHNGGNHCRLALHPTPNGGKRATDSLKQMGFIPAGSGNSFWQFNLDALNETPMHPFACLKRAKPPQLGLSFAEKNMLTLALWGLPDTEIARALNISTDTIKKRWQHVYQRIENLPELAQVLLPEQQKQTGRGPEKRRSVLQYLDDHLAEVRW